MQMLCDRCEEKPATVYLTQIINGKKTELHLCEQCAAESQKVCFDPELSFQNLLSGLLDMTVQHPQEFQNSYEALTCPTCQMTYQTFRKTGKFGCADCYNTFGSYLTPIFKRIHGNHTHIGKIPHNAKGELALKRKIEELRSQLQKAIQKEAFEEAAQLRDEIRTLEKGDATS
jgi:protein arginine kinase activator